MNVCNKILNSFPPSNKFITSHHFFLLYSQILLHLMRSLYQNDNKMTKNALIAPIIVYSYDNKKTNVQLTQVLLYKDCICYCM